MKMQKVIIVILFVVLLGSVSDSFAGVQKFMSHSNSRFSHSRSMSARHMPSRGKYVSVSWPKLWASIGVTRVVTVPVVRTVTVAEPVKVEPVVAPVEIVQWIRNENGSLTSVKLTQKGPGFIGPLGEYYPQMPTEEQLKVLYAITAENSPYKYQADKN